MALRIKADNPALLLSQLKERINAGAFPLWSIDDDGDFVYIREGWRGKAWMRPRATDTNLTFNILGRKKFHVTKNEYAVFHTRLAQILLSNFDDVIDSIEITALASVGDRVEEDE